VLADRKRLLQVMTNLLSNAAKFSPERDAVEIRMTESRSYVRIEVQDRGPGIPEAFRARIFGRFAQADSTASRQKGGTGLGLAICKRLVEMMRGRIGFEDRAGGGTTFWFELPRT
jgi:signal transduction histidine kinase